MFHLSLLMSVVCKYILMLLIAFLLFFYGMSMHKAATHAAVTYVCFLGPGCQPKVGILDLLLEMFMVCLSVSESVCWSRGWIVAKRLDRSRCRLACGVGRVTVTMY